MSTIDDFGVYQPWCPYPMFHYLSIRSLILAEQMSNIVNVTSFLFELACSYALIFNI